MNRGITFPLELRTPVGTFLFLDRDAYARHIIKCPKGHLQAPGMAGCQRCCTVALPLIFEQFGYRGVN